MDIASGGRARFGAWLVAVAACSSSTPSGGADSTSGSGEPPADGPSSGATTAADESSSSTDALTTGTTESGTYDPTFGMPPDFGADTEGPPVCETCSATPPFALDPMHPFGTGRAKISVAELADGRVLVAWHDHVVGGVHVNFLDPMDRSWSDGEVLREGGDFPARVAAFDSDTGPIVIEDTGTELHAHLDDGSWEDLPLDLGIGPRIQDVVEAPDGRIAVLVARNGSGDVGPSLALAWFDPVMEGWDPDVVTISETAPFGSFDGATVTFASDDGDALVAFTRDGGGAFAELHHNDSGTDSWALLDSGPVSSDAVPELRELEPGEFVYTRRGNDLQASDEPVLYSFSDETGLGELAGTPFPDDHVDGTLHAVRLTDGPTLTHRAYTLDRPADDVDMLELDEGSFSASLLAEDGHVYVTWKAKDGRAYVTMHGGDDGWADPIEVPLPGSTINGFVLLARNDTGDTLLTATSVVGDDYATMVSVYSEEADCWQPSVQLDENLDVQPFAFSTTRDFLLIGSYRDRAASILSCND